MDTRAWRFRLCRSAAAMAAALTVAATPADARAQASAPSGVVARTGELVRLRTARWLYTGTLARIANDTALLRFDADSALVARASITRAEVQRGTRRSTARIVLFSLGGAAAGAFIGGWSGALLECGGTCGDDGYLDGVAGGVLGAGVGLVGGAVAGGMLGARKRYPRWISAVLPASAP